MCKTYQMWVNINSPSLNDYWLKICYTIKAAIGLHHFTTSKQQVYILTSYANILNVFLQ